MTGSQGDPEDFFEGKSIKNGTNITLQSGAVRKQNTTKFKKAKNRIRATILNHGKGLIVAH